MNSLTEELDVIPVQSEDVTDMKGVLVSKVERESPGGELVSQVGGFSNEGMLSFEGISSSGSPSGNGFGDGQGSQEELDRLIDRTINASIVLAAGTFAITKLLTIDQNYWQVRLYLQFYFHFVENCMVWLRKLNNWLQKILCIVIGIRLLL